MPSKFTNWLNDYGEALMFLSIVVMAVTACVHDSNNYTVEDTYKYQVLDLDYATQGVTNTKQLDSNNCIQTTRKYVCGTFTISANPGYSKYLRLKDQ